MRRALLPALGAVLLALLLVSLFVSQPLLFSGKASDRTPFHDNLAVTGNQTKTDGALVLPEWAQSLNLTGPLALDIRLKDFDAAGMDLEQYLRSAGSLNGLVVRLDLSGSDVAAFQRNNTANVQSLRRLLNQTEEFDRLRGLEIQYRDERNPAMLRSVELRGDELRKLVRENYAGYAGRSENVVNLSQRFGLNTTGYEQSVLDFAGVVAMIEAEQGTRAEEVPQAIEAIRRGAEVPKLTFEVVPDRGAYRDLLAMRGRAPAGMEVTVFSDGRPLAGVVAGADGAFSFPYTLERIEAGLHRAYASAGTGLSPEAPFTVVRQNTTLALAARLAEANGTHRAICTGNLTAESGRPVRDAPIALLLDGRRAASAVTADNGSYRAELPNLTGGAHTLKARFDPAGFPLNGSESAPVVLEVPTLAWLITALVYAAGLALALAGAVLYLRRRKTVPPVSQAGRAPPPMPELHLPPVPTLEEATAAVEALTGPVDGRQGITWLYRQTVRQLDLRNPGRALRSKTPRELRVITADRPWGASFAELVAIHERVRHMGATPTEEDIRRTKEICIAVMTGVE